MSLAYAIVLVNDELMKNQARDTIQEAQKAADQKFEKIAMDNRLTRVTRNPEPHTMSHDELRKAMPHATLDGLTGLYFTADIS